MVTIECAKSRACNRGNILPHQVFCFYFLETEKWTALELPSTDWSPKCLPWWGLDQGQSWEQELHPYLPCGWQEPKDFSRHCCLTGSALARNWRQKHEPGIEPRYSSVGCGLSTSLTKHLLPPKGFMFYLPEGSKDEKHCYISQDHSCKIWGCATFFRKVKQACRPTKAM